MILNIGSHVGRFARAAFSGYCGSKFAVEGRLVAFAAEIVDDADLAHFTGFSEALAQEVENLGIQVCCVEPGDFRTSELHVLCLRVALCPADSIIR